LNFSDWVSNGWGWILAALLALAFMGYVGWILGEAFGQEVPTERSWMKDWFFWILPFGGALGRYRDMADALDILGDGLAAGLSLDAAVRGILALDINRFLRQRFVLLYEGLQRGTGLGVAAVQAGLPALAATMLGTAELTGSLPEAAGFLSRYYRMRFSRVWIMMQAALEPVMVISVGTLVGFVAYALFSPLVALIDAVNLNTGLL
jgi:type IV pilus assembly protein PilC